MPSPKDVLAANEATAEPKRVLCEDGANEVEVWLQTFGVKYTPVRQVPISKIDVKKSQANQARKEAIVPESVDRFATALRNGATFKPVVGYKSGASLVLIDGNNRVAAYAREKREFVPTIIVHPDTPSEVIHAMTVAANTGHGQTPDLNWRIRQAEFLVGLGYSQDEACKHAAVRTQQLQNHQRSEKATIRARDHKISGFDALPQHHKLKLGSLNSNPIFLQASRVVIDTDMTVAEVDAFIKEVKASQSDVLAEKIVARVAEDRRMAARNKAAMQKQPRIRSSKTALVSGLGKVLAADPGELARMILTEMERAEMKRRLAQAADHILELQIALETAMKEDVRDVG